MHERVVNIRHGVRYDIYCGRLSARQKQLGQFSWGNPYGIKMGRTRAESIKLYEQHLLERPWLVAKARKELRRKILGCFCHPLSCHADFLATVAESVPVPHEFEKHDGSCEKDGCVVCEGGLAICKHCGGGEGALTTECPRTRDMYDSDAVYKGASNYIFGQWVRGCISESGHPDMPCWAGPIYGSEPSEKPGEHPDD